MDNTLLEKIDLSQFIKDIEQKIDNNERCLDRLSGVMSRKERKNLKKTIEKYKNTLEIVNNYFN